MIDPTYSSFQQKSFGGAYNYADPTDVPITNGLQSSNVEYRGFGGLYPIRSVFTRLGFSLAFLTGDTITAIYNWISSLGNLLVWFRSSDKSVQYINIDTGGPQNTLIPGNLVGYGSTHAEAGARLYIAFFSTSGLGASPTRVVTYRGGFVNDLAFKGPITYVPPFPTETAGGQVTAGLHQLGYILEYRSGFKTRPSPDSGVGVPSLSTFVPLNFTASGNTFLTWSLTTTWPVETVNVYAIMTAVSNPAQWFIVPGAVQAVAGGVSSTITFTINISDSLLQATGIDVTNNLTLLTNTVSGVTQITPSVVLAHGNRMVYVCTILDLAGNASGALFVSDIGDYQSISADRNLVQLPGQRNIITAISLQGVLYIFGPQWTYETIDNNGDPVTWITPKLTDGRRGTLATRGVEVSPSGTYAWVASQEGLYRFQGYYQDKPVSYYQSTDWNRINWGVPYAVHVKDDPTVKKVYVMACLDGSVTPNFLLTWDYSMGTTPELMALGYSIDFLQAYPMGAMEVVKNSLPGAISTSSNRKELWLGSSASGSGLLRRNTSGDTNPKLDNTYPIFPTFETALLPRVGEPGEVLQHHGAHIRVKGTGLLSVKINSLDHSTTQTLDVVDLASSSGQLIFRGADVISEGVSYTFTQGQNLVTDPEFEGV